MIKVLIDSASDITQEEAEKKGIYMIPMEVRFGEDVYLILRVFVHGRDQHGRTHDPGGVGSSRHITYQNN